MRGAQGDQKQRLFKWTRLRRKTLLRMGVAGGFAAVFGAATNTPYASRLIVAELFGFEGLPFYIVTYLSAYIISGRTSVYAAQQLLLRKVSIRNYSVKKKHN